MSDKHVCLKTLRPAHATCLCFKAGSRVQRWRQRGVMGSTPLLDEIAEPRHFEFPPPENDLALPPCEWKDAREEPERCSGVVTH